VVEAPVVVVVGATVVVVVVGAAVVVVVEAPVVVVVGATVVVVVVAAAVVVVVGATVVVVVGATVVVVVVGATVVVVVVGATVEVEVLGPTRETNAAAGGVMAGVVLGCVMAPPVAATSGVVVPGGSKGAVWPNCAGPGVLAASKPVNRHVVVPAVPAPGLPPNGTVTAPPKMVKLAEVAETMPMLALPPAVPFVVNTLPELNVASVYVKLEPVPTVTGPAAAVVGALIVALDPSAATAVIVEFGLMPPPLGPATNVGFVAVPTSDARNVPAAPVNVVAPLAHETFMI